MVVVKVALVLSVKVVTTKEYIGLMKRDFLLLLKRIVTNAENVVM